jgi:(1->4)-alpha-D-glucan 1-alpha-D-glucosylmutase
MPHTPRATYRLQLHPGFGFDQVAELAPYLAELGVSHVYLSPYLRARPGSPHGYDVVDPSRIDPDRGGPEAHARMCQALQEHGLGQIVDVVPNHMAIATPHNHWWWDVLEHGPASDHSGHFDIDWDPPDRRLTGKVLLAILGDHYGRVLRDGHLRLVRSGARLELHVYEHPLPLAPRSLAGPLHEAARRADSRELASVASALEALPLPSQTDKASLARRRDGWAGACRQLEQLMESPAIAEALDAVVGELNGDREALDALIQRQNYRLAYWRAARHDLNYRRFFDVHELAGIRMEDARLFHDAHARVLEWIRDGSAQGLRIDHPDGLRDPQQYFERLREQAPHAWIVAEKILEPGEALPASWPVDGTTGYDTLNVLTGVLVDPEGEPPMTDLYLEFTGERTADAHALVHDKKLKVLRELFGSEIRRTAERLARVCESHPDHRDHTMPDLREALIEALAALPVYRTYVRTTETPRDTDIAYVREALELARSRRPDLDGDLFELLDELLCGRMEGEDERTVVADFQQISGAAMAKGLEDTAFYCFHRLVCLNEVGGDPDRFGLEPDAFHRHAERIHARWPRTMVATSTHDTKRSEDVRARIALLSEIPDRWRAVVARLSEIADKHRRDGWPDRLTEYLVYQTLVGTWPISSERMLQFMEKAAREAKLHTAWRRINRDYERALFGFVQSLFADDEFVSELEGFVDTLVEPARVNALVQTLLKVTVPGVPDIYQGTELWDDSLVDPDNRRPVDFERRRALLREVPQLSPEALMERAGEGLPKLWVLRQGLQVRRQHAACFEPDARYDRLEPEGPRARHLLAFMRGQDVIVAVPRLLLRLGDDWEGTRLTLPEGSWRNALTGESHGGGPLAAEQLFARFPVALLTRQAPQEDS